MQSSLPKKRTPTAASRSWMRVLKTGGVTILAFLLTGLTAHPCDYYEITVSLDKNK